MDQYEGKKHVVHVHSFCQWHVRPRVCIFHYGSNWKLISAAINQKVCGVRTARAPLKLISQKPSLQNSPPVDTLSPKELALVAQHTAVAINYFLSTN
jgi:hypothetical protein